MTHDSYRTTAGTYDLISAGYVADQLSALDTFLSRVDPCAGAILDIGCGSGRHLAHVLDRLPEAQVIGLEPSDAMRSLALARLAATPEWRDRVTVRPEGALEAPLPGKLSGVVMLGVFGHFTRSERAHLFDRLSARLPQDAPVLLDLQLPEEPTEVKSYMFADTHLGALRYRGFAEASPIGAESMQWRMTYQTLDGDAVLEQHTSEAVYQHPRHSLVEEELRDHGFSLSRLPDATYWLAVHDGEVSSSL